MENKQSVSKNTNKNNGVFRKDVYMGVVSLIKEMDKDAPLAPASIVLEESQTRKITAMNIRQMVFQNLNYQAGEDLMFRLGMSTPYTYKIMNSNEDYKNNTIVIGKEQSLNEFLDYMGFPSFLKPKDLRVVKKMLLSSDFKIQMQPHMIDLKRNVTVINPEMVAEVNAQGMQLFNFKASKLPTEPRKIEKVYAKYFK